MYASNEDEEWVYLQPKPTLSDIENEFEEKNSLILSERTLSSSDDEETSLSTYSTSRDEEKSTTPKLLKQRRKISVDRVKRIEKTRINDDKIISYVFLVILFVLPFLLGYFVSKSNQPALQKVFDELGRVNQRLNGISSTPTKQIEDELIAQVNTLTLQLEELRENLTSRIQQLTLENQRLRDEIKSQDESSTEKLFVSILKKTSTHLGDVFHHLSESVTNVFDQTQEFLRQNRRFSSSQHRTTFDFFNRLKNRQQNSEFPMKQIRSVQNWAAKIIRR